MEGVNLYCGDCLETMPNIPAYSVDLILCDLPYGTTHCSWDSVISLDILWRQYKNVIVDNGVICLFGTQPFSTILISSNLEMYKYNWYWQKDSAANFLNKNYQPGKIIEEICVFSKSGAAPNSAHNMKYYPILEKGHSYTCKNNVEGRLNAANDSNLKNVVTSNNGTRLPNNILIFQRDKVKVHPTQKPVALLEYLIKTYTNAGDLVLDNCMGSGSTGVACMNTGRRFIGIEKEEKYFDIANERIEIAYEKALCKVGNEKSLDFAIKNDTQMSFDFCDDRNTEASLATNEQKYETTKPPQRDVSKNAQVADKVSVKDINKKK